MSIAILLSVAASLPGMERAGAQGTDDFLVYVVELEGTIDAGQRQFLNRALSEAAEAGADLVLLEITTLGGWIDAALDMGDLIIWSRVPVWTYVKSRAWSAGVLISISGEKMIMAPGSSIGAAEPRPADEKSISAWRGELEATADFWGRDPKIVAAMVDKTVSIEGLVDAGALLTLKARDALEIGFADAIAPSRAEALAQMGIDSFVVVDVTSTPAERLASVVTGPVVAPLLLTLGFLALVAEIFVPGFGLPGLLGISALGLYFGGHMLAGFAGWEVLALFALGLLLLMGEVFVSGFGVLGVGGITALAASILLAAPSPGVALRSLFIAMGTSVVAVVVLLRYGRKLPFWSRLVLMESERPEQGYLAIARRQELVGLKGMSITPLRPSGTVEIEEKLYDVVAEGGFVASGVPVKVVNVQGTRIVVRADKSSAGPGDGEE